jgi:hypothetical protein
VVVVASEIATRLRLVREFPGLAESPFEVTSEPDPNYNCIAWAAGDTEHFWWPGLGPGCFWPPSVPRATTRVAFVRAFQKIGYRPCTGPEPEDGFEKIALYELDGSPTHAAKLLANGRWSSKLGRFHDISHSLDGLNGQQYGEPVLFMRRATT